MDKMIRLEEALAALKSERDAAYRDVAAEQHRCGQFKQQLDALTKTLLQVQKERDQQISMVNDLQDKLSFFKDKWKATSNEKDTMQKKGNELSQQLAALSETLQKVQIERDEKTSTVKGLKSELDALIRQYNHIVGRLQNIRNIVHTVNKDIDCSISV